MGKVTEVHQDEFDEKVKNGKVVVDCYAVWCGPCQMLAPVLEQLAEENDAIHFYKLNVDEAEEIAAKYGILSIPTLLLFENGILKKTLVGLKSKSELEEELTAL